MTDITLKSDERNDASDHHQLQSSTWSHMYCNLSATALRQKKTAATSATTVRSKVHFFGCRSIGDWSATTIPKNRRPVGDWWAFDCQLIGNGLRLVDNWLVTGRWQLIKTVAGLSATAATGRRPVANQSATSRQPVGDHQKPFYDRFGRREVSLAATKTSLRPNRPSNLLQPVGDHSPTSLQPPCNLLATTRNFGRKQVADRLQAMCDWGFTGPLWGESPNNSLRKDQ